MQDIQQMNNREIVELFLDKHSENTLINNTITEREVQQVAMAIQHNEWNDEIEALVLRIQTLLIKNKFLFDSKKVGRGFIQKTGRSVLTKDCRTELSKKGKVLKGHDLEEKVNLLKAKFNTR